MLSLLKEFIVETVFPARCAGCKQEGSFLCGKCELFLVPAELFCFECGKESKEGLTHKACKTAESPGGLVVLWNEESIARNLSASVPGCRELFKKGVARMLSQPEQFSSFLVLFSSASLVPLSEGDRNIVSENQGGNGSDAVILTKSLDREAIRKKVGKLQEKGFKRIWAVTLCA